MNEITFTYVNPFGKTHEWTIHEDWTITHSDWWDNYSVIMGMFKKAFEPTRREKLEITKEIYNEFKEVFEKDYELWIDDELKEIDKRIERIRKIK